MEWILDITWHLLYLVYTSIINLLDYTACAFPVTFADKSIDKFDPDYKPLNVDDEEEWKTCT
jgi:amidase